MKITLVVAAAENRAIGKNNELLWHLPDDLKFFKEYTMGKVIVMGRKTFESVGSRPLPKRTNVIVTRQHHLDDREDIRVCHSLEEVYAAFSGEPEICICGGEEIYRMAMEKATDIRLTRVHTEKEGDAFFPGFSSAQWKEVAAVYHPADDRHLYAMTFCHYVRSAHQ